MTRARWKREQAYPGFLKGWFIKTQRHAHEAGASNFVWQLIVITLGGSLQPQTTKSTADPADISVLKVLAQRSDQEPRPQVLLTTRVGTRAFLPLCWGPGIAGTVFPLVLRASALLYGGSSGESGTNPARSQSACMVA